MCQQCCWMSKKSLDGNSSLFTSWFPKTVCALMNAHDMITRHCVQEAKLLPPEPTASVHSEEEEEEDDEEEEEEEDAPHNPEYVAAVCQYTTVLKE